MAQLLILRPKSSSTTLLECGSGHGWFLEEAKKANFIALGIEPSMLINKRPAAHLNVRQGYFPEALNPEEKFDIICFNDVFEHIPDIQNVVTACSRHLNPKGLLIINLPSSQGFFYRLATLLARFHYKGFFERLWQKDFPSPHLYYFSPTNLRRFLQSHGFRSVRTQSLTSVRRQGLWARLRTDKNSNILSSLVIFPILIFILPFISMLPSDIHCEFFEKENL
ncbi:MAG: class I SAM-dependent methyltransferase [Bdellovibrionales bacterium]|nr:class I SAM-dependent methyltransferase [Bdellovibrionales bacterium]